MLLPIAPLLVLLPAAAVAPTAVASAPITQVTVYSDRAQITRHADVQLHGEAHAFVLPLLLDSIDPTSVRVVATGGEVERVDLTYVPESEFPQKRAKELLASLQAIDAEIDLRDKERAAWQQLLDTARGLRATVSTSEKDRPPPKLNPLGWTQGTQLSRTNVARAQKKIMALDLALRALHRKRQPLAEEAGKLGATRARSGHRVTAIVRGRGAARLALSYMVQNARWQPSYDIQLQPSTGKVQLQFAGVVSQESGEDWNDAQLTLSTAVPATATRYPKIPTWTIGERERFIPTPRPVQEYIPPAPPARPMLRAQNDDDRLRQLLARYAGVRGGDAGAAVTGSTVDTGVDTDHDGIPDVADRCPNEAETYNGMDDEDGCPDRGRVIVRSDDLKLAENTPAPTSTPMAPPPPPPPPQPEPVVAESRSYSGDARVAREKTVSRRSPGASFKTAPADAPPEPTEALGLLPAGGWVRPSYAGNLPASLAGGHDLFFPSIAKETVPSGKGQKRVALLSRNWPVAVERKLFPALAPEAYLVAELKSPEKEPLPGGQANLFVGADPAGTAALQLMVPGAPFTLPLGLDAAVRPVRNVKVTTVEKGVISKDEISEYTVTIEIANPHRTEIAMRVLDQIPVTPNKSVEAKLVRVEPPTTAQDAAKGSLEWRVNLGAGQKTTLTFVYTLKRPKGHRLYQ